MTRRSLLIRVPYPCFTIMMLLVALLLPACSVAPEPATLGLVSARGGQLIAGGRMLEVRGINYTHPTGANMDVCGMLQFGADGNCPWEAEPIERDFDRLHELGVNTVRVFLNYYVFGGAKETQPAYDIEPALKHLEYFVDAANQRGIYVMPVLMAKYPQDTFAPQYYERTLALHVRPVVSRFAGRPGILAWDVFNEPDIGSPVNIRCWDWDNGDEPACLPMAEERMRFLNVVHDEIKKLDPQHLVTTSMAFGKNYFEPQQAFMRMADLVDFYSVHYYDRSPPNSGRYAQHWYYGQGFPADLERVIAELASLKLDKPILISEIGFPTGPDDDRVVADLHQEMAAARRVIRDKGGSGMLIWPFQGNPDDTVGDVFRE